jgi:uncharacterized membrane protein YeaQ/YmgE (transglycosylase-associated protein family)
MIGMSFGGFLTLLVLGFIAAIVMHSAVRYRMLGGFDGLVAKWVAGWIGVWLGSPVLGHWSFQIQHIYVIPALIGAFVGAFSYAAWFKANAVSVAGATTSKMATTAGSSEVMRKAS